jgi:hypothetical protein
MSDNTHSTLPTRRILHDCRVVVVGEVAPWVGGRCGLPPGPLLSKTSSLPTSTPDEPRKLRRGGRPCATGAV